MRERQPGICFLSRTRYASPLNETTAKKFALLAQIGPVFVIGFAGGMTPSAYHEHASFYLLPSLPTRLGRNLLALTLAVPLTLWLARRRGVRYVIAQSPYEGVAGALAKAAAKLLRMRLLLIVESHGDFEGALFLQQRIRGRHLYSAVLSCAARFALRNADALRSVSLSTAAQLQAIAPNKPIATFPTWTDIGPFLAAGGGERRNHAGGQLLFAGAITPLKGVHQLIAAFAALIPQHADASLLIAGPETDEAYASGLRDRFAEIIAGGQLAFVGSLPQPELAERMRQATALVLPSLSEGLPRVVIEAMSTGTPVVATRVGGIPELIQDGVTGWLVPPGDERALAERLAWVFQHKGEVGSAGERAREAVIGLFSPERYLADYKDLLQRSELGASA